ncbi:MAG: hypothetical protein JJ863_06890 [Deltaproteobacteria bacterium]|nr:hypothetical protein [Deltaproteobacteria bacterium]
MSRWCLFCSALLALSACDDEEECRANTDRIQQRLDALPTGPLGTVPEGIEAPEAEGEPLVYGVPQLVIETDGDLVLNGAPIDSADQIERQLRISNEQRRQWHGPEWGPGIQVWADRSHPFAQLQGVVETLAGREAWLLVAKEQPEPPPPCPDSLGEVCHPSGDPSTRATVLAEAATRVMEGCEPLERFFARIASMDAGEKEGAFRRGFAPAVRECDCDMDMPAIEYLAVVVGGGIGPRVTRLRLQGSSEGTVGDWVASRASP